jgi:hypothetical protein
VDPFCLVPEEPAVIAGTVLSAWTALPSNFQGPIHRGREKAGGVELEVNLSFLNEFKGEMWMRCRVMLDANMTNKTPCTTFILTHRNELASGTPSLFFCMIHFGVEFVTGRDKCYGPCWQEV